MIENDLKSKQQFLNKITSVNMLDSHQMFNSISKLNCSERPASSSSLSTIQSNRSNSAISSLKSNNSSLSMIKTQPHLSSSSLSSLSNQQQSHNNNNNHHQSSPFLNTSSSSIISPSFQLFDSYNQSYDENLSQTSTNEHATSTPAPKTASLYSLVTGGKRSLASSSPPPPPICAPTLNQNTYQDQQDQEHDNHEQETILLDLDRNLKSKYKKFKNDMTSCYLKDTISEVQLTQNEQNTQQNEDENHQFY